jgi:hypothetical protein
MKKKKILIVSKSFYPIIAPRAFRATELAKEFARQGHYVTVLTCNNNSFDYSSFEKKYNIKIIDYVNSKWIDIKPVNIFLKVARFLLNYIILFPDIQLVSLIYKALKNIKGYDLLISIANPYPTHWGVALAKAKNKNLCKIWIADCGDPFMGDKERKLRYPIYFYVIENWFFRKPDFITVPIKEAIMAYPSYCREKIRVIPQGINFNQIKKIKNSINKVKNPFPVFIYAGGLSREFRNPKKFLEYLSTLDCNFKFIIYTNDQHIIDESIILRLNNKIKVYDYIPREKLWEELIKADFVVDFKNKNKVHVPSKLIDYAVLDKPILSIDGDNINKNIINQFINGNYTNRIIINNIDNYNISNVVIQLLNIK